MSTCLLTVKKKLLIHVEVKIKLSKSFEDQLIRWILIAMSFETSINNNKIEKH